MDSQDVKELANSFDLIESSAADRFIQGLTKKLDKEIEDEIGKGERETIPADSEGEEKSSAMPVSDALKAIHLASLKIIFRVIPRSIESLLILKVLEISEKIGLQLAAKLILNRIPFLGQMLSVSVGVIKEKEYNDQIEANIRGVLGIKGNEFDAYPLRKMISHDIKKKKEALRKQPRLVKKVHTRIYNRDTSYSGSGGDF